MAALGFNDRRHKRKAFMLDAALEFHDGSPSRPCVVLDISDGGACIGIQRTPLPKKFTLVLSASGNVRRACLLKWRRDDEIGVQFLQRANSPAAAPETRSAGSAGTAGPRTRSG